MSQWPKHLNAIDLPLQVVHPLAALFLPCCHLSAALPEIFFFMTFVVRRHLSASEVPVHVLVVVVGSYLNQLKDLHGAGSFAQEIVDFWRDAARIFPAGKRLASVNVLASDPRGVVRITGDQGPILVDRPNYSNSRTALLDWANLIAAVNDGTGLLHWIGHGTEQVFAGGGIVNLACDGPDASDPARQSGIDWTRSVARVDQITNGHPVYCFVDTCRTLIREREEFEGLGNGALNWASRDNAQVFMSTARSSPAFWILQPTLAALRAGCGAHALGTRAFLAGLEGFGARSGGSEPLPVVPAQLIEAADVLVGRWARHQGVPAGSPQSPLRGDVRPVLFTAKPTSVVDVLKQAVLPNSCEAQASTATTIEVSETNQAPHEFRLARKPHKFRFDGQNWHPEKALVHPYVPFSEQEFP